MLFFKPSKYGLVRAVVKGSCVLFEMAVEAQTICITDTHNTLIGVAMVTLKVIFQNAQPVPAVRGNSINVMFSKHSLTHSRNRLSILCSKVAQSAFP